MNWYLTNLQHTLPPFRRGSHGLVKKSIFNWVTINLWAITKGNLVRSLLEHIKHETCAMAHLIAVLNSLWLLPHLYLRVSDFYHCDAFSDSCYKRSMSSMIRFWMCKLTFPLQLSCIMLLCQVYLFLKLNDFFQQLSNLFSTHWALLIVSETNSCLLGDLHMSRKKHN